MHALRLVFVGIAIGLLVILGLRINGIHIGSPIASLRRTAPPAPLTPELARATVDAQIKSAGEYARFFQTVREQFPADYERMLEGFAERARTEAQAQSPDVYLAEALRALRQSHGVLAAKASIGMIERVFEHQARIVNTLAQANPQLCADFLYGNAAQGFFQFSAKNRGLIAATAEAGLEAIMEGRSLGIERAPPGDQDFAMLEAELEKKGLGKPEIEALLDGRTPEPALSDAAMCKAGVIYYETLRDLPREARLRIYALTIRMLARG